MLSDGLILALEKGGLGAVIVGLLFIAAKLIDKYKPTAERRADDLQYQDSQLASLRTQIEHYKTDIQALQRDVASLRAELRTMSQERHFFYAAITRCTVEHPVTSEWWRAEMDSIAARLKLQ